MYRLHYVIANIYTIKLTFKNHITIFLHSIKSYEYKGAVGVRWRA